MLHHLLAKGLVRALAVFGLLAGVMTYAAASNAAPYPPGITTTTNIVLSSATVQPGESTTARVSVSASAGQPQGTVTFRVAGRQPETLPLVNGEASWQTPTDLAAGRTYRVTARYNGTTGGGTAMGAESGGVASVISLVSSSSRAGYKPSSDTAYLTVAAGDVESSEGDEAMAASAGDSTSGLPSVGQDSTTQVAAVAGAAMLAVGGFLLYRRRARG